MKKDLRLAPFTMRLYGPCRRLWEETPGIGLTPADERENLASFLRRNRSLSFLALRGGEVVGTVLAGHDGRRGFLYHLCVAEVERSRGLGKRLVDTALRGLADRGIQKCHVMVFADNETGKRFWIKAGFSFRSDLGLFSKNL